MPSRRAAGPAWGPARDTYASRPDSVCNGKPHWLLVAENQAAQGSWSTSLILATDSQIFQNHRAVLRERIGRHSSVCMIARAPTHHTHTPPRSHTEVPSEADNFHWENIKKYRPFPVCGGGAQRTLVVGYWQCNGIDAVSCPTTWTVGHCWIISLLHTPFLRRSKVEYGR